MSMEPISNQQLVRGFKPIPIPTTLFNKAAELEGVQVPVPRDCRVVNTKGNCVWCSLELLARYAEVKELYNITKNVKEWWR